MYLPFYNLILKVAHARIASYQTAYRYVPVTAINHMKDGNPIQSPFPTLKLNQ